MKKILFLILVNNYLFAQTGTIKGNVFDINSAENLVGATVIVKGTDFGAVTDIDGNYSISNLPINTYSLLFSYISYEDMVINEVVVEPNSTTVINPKMIPDLQQLEEVIVNGTIIRDNEDGLRAIKKKSANLLDGISAEKISRIGDGDAATVIKRIPGVSLQQGKYALVRGLGDRYSKTILNGMEIPSLDPDKNSVQLDIFPTFIVDNIIIKKSYTADLPAEFTGGIIDIQLKDFPEKKVFDISFNIGYNSYVHFNKNNLDYERGKTDFLGFDDGTRKLPISSQFGQIPLEVYAKRDKATENDLRKATLLFNPTFAATNIQNTLNYGFKINFGNQYLKKKYTLGYNAAFSYNKTTSFYENIIDNNLYEKSSEIDNYDLSLDRERTGSLSNDNILLSGIGGVTFKTIKSKLNVMFMHTQNGESICNKIFEKNYLQASNQSEKYGIQYTQKSISSIIFSGEHLLKHNNLRLDWKLTPVFSTIKDKDVRQVPFTLSGEFRDVQPSEGGNPRRLWRYIDEINYSGKVNLKKDFNLRGKSSDIMFGASHVYKVRDFSIENFDFFIANSANLKLNGNPNTLLLEKNVYSNGIGTYVTASYQPSNSYAGSMSTSGLFVTSQLAFSKSFKAVLGLRLEQYIQRYTGGDQNFFNSQGGQGVYLNNEKVLESLNLFPTINFIYNLSNHSNFRTSFARTIARPSFKEKSIAEIFDPLSNTFWIGNIDLIETNINNYDLRYEYSFKNGQVVSVSSFYKTFKNPIEIVVINQNTPDQFTAKNNGNASVIGIEIETTKNLAFVAPYFKSLSLNFNASYIQSRLEIGEEEYNARKNNLRMGEPLDDYRVMQGQSPYMINVGLSYSESEKKFSGGVFYNVQGPSLARVGIGNIPDLYNEPFNSLNINLAHSFGYKRQTKLQIMVNNVLNDAQQTVFSSFNTENRISSSRYLGRTYSFKLSHSF